MSGSGLWRSTGAANVDAVALDVVSTYSADDRYTRHTTEMAAIGAVSTEIAAHFGRSEPQTRIIASTAACPSSQSKNIYHVDTPGLLLLPAFLFKIRSISNGHFGYLSSADHQNTLVTSEKRTATAGTPTTGFQAKDASPLPEDRIPTDAVSAVESRAVTTDRGALLGMWSFGGGVVDHVQMRAA